MTQTFYLSMIQALTEFLPVSSTAHLIALSKLWSFREPGRLIEVALHMATLAVVLVYFRKDVMEGFRGLKMLFKGKLTQGLHRWFMIAGATIPVVIAGYFYNRYMGKGMRSLEVMGWASIFFGALLFLVDRASPAGKRFESMTYKDAFIVGLLQVIALIPGASRSGTTLIAARLLGYERRSAARFSFLLSIPVVIGAMTLMLSGTCTNTIASTALLWPLLLCFGLGYLVLSFLMLWLKHGTFAIFGLYRILFGGYLLYVVYG